MMKTEHFKTAWARRLRTMLAAEPAISWLLGHQMLEEPTDELCTTS